jgi:hypothetical protein
MAILLAKYPQMQMLPRTCQARMTGFGTTEPVRSLFDKILYHTDPDLWVTLVDSVPSSIDKNRIGVLLEFITGILSIDGNTIRSLFDNGILEARSL